MRHLQHHLPQLVKKSLLWIIGSLIFLAFISSLSVIGFAILSPKRHFLPAPQPLLAEEVYEVVNGGFGTTWATWKTEYQTHQSLLSVIAHYQNEMDTYCITPYPWTEDQNGTHAQCYVDICDPPEEVGVFLVGRGPFQQFSITVAQMPDGTTSVSQEHFFSYDNCLERKGQ